MGIMSALYTDLQLDWTRTWFGYSHDHSDYEIIVFDDGCVLESKTWPHPIMSGTLAELVHFVSVNEGITWTRRLDVEPAYDHGPIKAGLAAITVGLLLWALIALAVWTVWP